MWAAEAKVAIDIPLTYKDSWDNCKEKEYTFKTGEVITVTKGRHEKYALWAGFGIFDLPEGYVGDIIKIISE